MEGWTPKANRSSPIEAEFGQFLNAMLAFLIASIKRRSGNWIAGVGLSRAAAPAALSIKAASDGLKITQEISSHILIVWGYLLGDFEPSWASSGADRGWNDWGGPAHGRT